MIEVVATQMGYINNRRMKEGQHFELKNEKQFSNKWMKKVEEEKPKEVIAKKNARLGTLIKQEEDVI
jgi:hypothetical protein